MISPTKIYDNPFCVICYDEFEKNQVNECLLLKCGHVFHENCVAPWINKEKNCPTCRARAIVHVEAMDVVVDIVMDIVKEIKRQGINGVERAFDRFFKLMGAAFVFVCAINVLNFLSPGAWEIKEEDKWDFNDVKNSYKTKLTLLAIAVIGSFFFLKKWNNCKNQQVSKINYQPQDQ